MYNESLEELYKKYDTDEHGLKENNVKNSIEKYGYNIIEEAKGKSKLKRFLEQFNDLMIIVLIIVAILTFVYGLLYSHDFTDSIVIFVVVFINAIMGYLQEQKAEVTLSSLKKYEITNCKVKRDSKTFLIKSEYLVPGDVILLEAGDKVPADARIIESNNLEVDESQLTGESIPVKKMKMELIGKKEIQEQINMIFSGSNITMGSCKALVVKTGMNTELGTVAKSLNTPYEVSTPLKMKIKEISTKLTFLVFIIILFIFFYGLIKDYKIMEIIMLCVSLAVAVIPEGLPAVITIALSTGADSLAKKKTIVRQMSAVETLGATDIICSDKTGTITQNKMQVKDAVISDNEMFNYISILANETIIDQEKLIGDQTETCLFDYAAKSKIDVLKFRKEHERIISAPFDSERKMMSSINSINNNTYLLTKGSLENLIHRCKYIKVDGQEKKLTDNMILEIINTETSFANKALRVIGFAYKKIDTIPLTVEDALKEENDLVYVGLVGIIDPPRDSVKEAVSKCFAAGIRPIMITGDSLLTACAIAKDVGIIKDNSEGIMGSELDKYSDEELVLIVKKYNVYARVNPKHKERIVKAWQMNNKVVGMTGDGVNDAPAIKDAHVGIGMGITGTEVTKSVADIILLDDSFSTIVDAVEEGRRIFSNIRNNVVYSLSSNFAELFIVLIGIITGYNILLPIHILFIDLVTDTIPSICLSFEKAENNIMNKRPRGIDKPIFTPFICSCIICSAVIETVFALFTFFVIAKYFDRQTAASLTLLSIVIQEIVYAISCRNLKIGIMKQGIFSNKHMNIGLLIVIFIELIVFMTPIRKLVHISAIHWNILLIVVIFNILGFIAYELFKPVLNRVFKD